ncbi:GNAT family N-acetyltransferase [Spiroplasma phoeniceum]|uniref:N-acetyltransferase domain-containing protein n=1 Tax=Spiroplasma phoeniceum P40 TaxID=1276259 RepID=A0A345DR54_9MOLU|nr:MarR family transcriptional regulator/GNAT family N-acetyltransferase [Spiroplasma phoeniceum]AXF96695.1 hypothetical protein SDAV_001742 [Spiroplasma phoeniceum P40]
MFNFNSEKINQLVVNYINYTVDPKHDNEQQQNKLDSNNFFYQIDTRQLKKSINGVISSHLATSEQFAKAGEIIDEYYSEKTPFIWCTITVDNNQAESSFFEKNGLTYLQTGIGMMIDLKTFTAKSELLKNEKFNPITDLTMFCEEKKPKLITTTNLKIISDADLPLKDLPTSQPNPTLDQVNNLCYAVTLTKDETPMTTGILFFEATIAVIRITDNDDNSENKKKMLMHLLHQAKKANYQTVGIVVPDNQVAWYQKLGFEPQDLYFNTYVMHYSQE